MAKTTETNSETGAVVTSFTNFCFCPNDLLEKHPLDANNVCTICGTQWS